MNWAGRLAEAAIKTWLLPLRVLGRKFQSLATQELLEGSVREVAVADGVIRFFTPNMLTFWRAGTLLDKEPETIEWLESFGADDLLWDIGANIGLYSLYAAMVKKNRVFAFEPNAANYFTLCRNIRLNGCDDKVSAFCLAFSDQSRLDVLNMSNSDIGGAEASFGSTTDFTGAEFTPQFRQGMIGFSIDEFIERFQPPLPNHLKIDVDGIEGLIINGARRLLANPELKSISIELDERRADEVALVNKTVIRAGFRLQHKKHAAAFDGGRFDTCYNHLFVRQNMDETS